MLSWTRITNHTNSTAKRSTVATDTSRLDLQIRSLLDDPALRRAMGLDQPQSAAEAATVSQATVVKERPRRRFDRRSLLEAVPA